MLVDLINLAGGEGGVDMSLLLCKINTHLLLQSSKRVGLKQPISRACQALSAFQRLDTGLVFSL